MRALSKAFPVIAILAAVAQQASAADGRSVNAARFAGARASVATPAPGSVHYNADGVPFPTGHGGTSASPDFQLMR
jgi:hypothetical protein